MARPLYEIGEDIARDYREQGREVYFGAVPYLRALRHLETVSDKYGEDDGGYIVLYLLSNLSTWRGPKAREIKAELRKLVK